MKVFRVQGDDDYGALTFEEEFGVDKVREGVAKGETKFMSADETSWYGEVHEFGEVDAKFVTFIQDHFMDYDDCKHTNFYVL